MMLTFALTARASGRSHRLQNYPPLGGWIEKSRASSEMAPEIAFGDEPESRRLDFAARG